MRTACILSAMSLLAGIGCSQSDVGEQQSDSTPGAAVEPQSAEPAEVSVGDPVEALDGLPDEFVGTWFVNSSEEALRMVLRRRDAVRYREEIGILEKVRGRQIQRKHYSIARVERSDTEVRVVLIDHAGDELRESWRLSSSTSLVVTHPQRLRFARAVTKDMELDTLGKGPVLMRAAHGLSLEGQLRDFEAKMFTDDKVHRYVSHFEQRLYQTYISSGEIITVRSYQAGPIGLSILASVGPVSWDYFLSVDTKESVKSLAPPERERLYRHILGKWREWRLKNGSIWAREVLRTEDPEIVHARMLPWIQAWQARDADGRWALTANTLGGTPEERLNSLISDCLKLRKENGLDSSSWIEVWEGLKVRRVGNYRGRF